MFVKTPRFFPDPRHKNTHKTSKRHIKPHKTHISHETHIHTLNTLDKPLISSYSTFRSITRSSSLMVTAHAQGQKQRVRITLDMEVFQDFNARDIDFDKLFNLEPSEKVEVYVEEFD